MPSAQTNTAPAINAQDGLPQHRTFLLHREIGIALIAPQKLAKTLQLFDRGKHPPKGVKALRTHYSAKCGVLRL